MLKWNAIVAALALALLALPVATYQDCGDDRGIAANGGCVSWTTCQILDDATDAYQGPIRRPFQQCG